MKLLFTKKDHRRRNYLHSKVNKKWLLNDEQREIIIPHTEIQEAAEDIVIKELFVKFGYNIQTSII